MERNWRTPINPPPVKRPPSKIPAANFLGTVAANIDNEKMTDAEFRAFIRRTLPIVQYDDGTKKD